MTAFDYIVLGILGVFMLLGLMRGAVREMFSLVGWLVAFYVAKTWHAVLLPYVPTQLSSETLRLIITFVVMFLLVLLCCSLIALLLTALIKAVGLGGLNRLLGGAVASVRGLVWICLLVMLAGMTELPKDPRWSNAMLSAPLEALVQQLLPWLPETISQKVHLGHPDRMMNV